MNVLKIFNTLTGKKEIFKPINRGKIKIYVCGITAYDFCHLGHGRTFVVFDAIVRYLRYGGYQVDYVRNITDIDDKIIKRAEKNNEKIDQLTNRMIKEMHLDLDTLNVLRPTHEPKVTEYIDAIVEFILLLIKKNHAYISSNGDVMFSINTMYDYGILSHKKNEKIKKTCDVNHNLTTPIILQSPIDFVLWKTSKFGEPNWSSPWGLGRPGWHIECSAMSYAILGSNLDIHGGGADLIFPHHDNEIAQSICAYDESYVNFWIHSGMLLFRREKMSKSLNNFYTIRDSLKYYDAETMRYFFLSAHYRSQLQYDNNNLKSARSSLERLYIALRDTDLAVPPIGGEDFISKFMDKMNDDFNTPAAYSVLFEIAHMLNDLKFKHHPNASGIASTLKYLANILGLLYQQPEVFLQRKMLKNNIELDTQTIEKLLQLREHARKNNQWKLADEIRKKLIVMGLILEDDVKGSTKWRYNNFI